MHPEEMESYLHSMSGTVKELAGQRLDGSQFPMRMSVSEVNSDGVHLFTAILRDITKEKENQARITAQQDLIELERSKLASLLDTTVSV